MSIIISKNGKDAVKIDKTPFGLEKNIQKYIHNNPESIPLYDIKDDIKLLILDREFPTKSGPIDALGVDRDGEIYLIETKFYKNPDKRTVVAQVLDYGAALWKSHPDLDSFLFHINNSVQATFHQTVRERIQTYFSFEVDDDTETLIANMGKNLHEGNFKFVVLMDTIHDQLKDLILYMNQNSKFDIYGVELEYYKHDEFEIIIPKLFGAEVKKDVTSKNTELSEKSKLELDFWSKFVTYAQDKKTNLKLPLPRPIFWYGISDLDIHLMFYLNRKTITCGLTIDNSKDLYEKFYANKDNIESELGEKLDWIQKPDTKRRNINISHPAETEDPEKWEACFEWLLQEAEKFYKVFSKYAQS